MYLIAFAFSAVLTAAVAYATTLKLKNDRTALTIGRVAFHAATVAFMVACSVQMYLIFTHQFQYTYIWQHTSRNLSGPLLFASFYAGQEGSFMLWTLLTFLIGVFVMSYSNRTGYETPVMLTYSLILVCLLLILVVKSPFITIFQSFPDEKIAADFLPADGKGLNPTLENIWITIHPPILFTGFAAMSVPFVFAIAGLIRKDYQKWVSIALPWTLFASMVLGFGIMLGGWWAYETLGWGGFWAWDPVENSSLIPWLCCVALVHSMLVQKRTGGVDKQTGEQKIGGLVKTNFVLAIATFGLILYSTFLTRSGVLGDTSVHSFVDPGKFVYVVLLSIIALFMGGGLCILAWRWRHLLKQSQEMRLLSREMALALGSSVLLASSMFVLIGTSWPVIMEITGQKKVALQADFYNTPHIWIAVGITLLNTLGMVVKWKKSEPAEVFKRIRIAVAVALAGTAGLALLGVTAPQFILLGFSATLAIVVNIQTGWKIIRGNWKFVGAYVSHAGVSLLLIGVIFTSRYSQTEHVRLKPGQSQQVFGYKVTYTGADQVNIDRQDQERYKHKVVLEKDGSSHLITPVVFWSDYNKRQSPFVEPGILYTPTRDIYITPKSIDEEGGNPRATLRKGQKAVMPFDSSVTVRLEKFDMSRAQGEGMQGAVVQVTMKDTAFFLTSYRTMSDQSFKPEPIPGTDMSIGFYDLEADTANLANSKAVLQFRSTSHPPGPVINVVTLDISVKPFISLVWGGVIIMVGGFFFAILRRRKEIGPFERQAEPAGNPVPDTGKASLGGAGAIATRRNRS